MRWVWRQRRNLTRKDQAFPAIRAWAALVRVAAVQDHGSLIETGLEKPLVGVVADRIRHDPIGIRYHPVAGNDDVAFNAAHGDPYWREDCAGPSFAGNSMVTISVSTARIPAMIYT